MKLLIRKAKVVDPQSPYNGKVVDLFIEGDKITSIGTDLKRNADQVVERPGLHVSPGWVDIGVQVGDPGLEHREDLRTVRAAAASGGFTAIAAWPNTDPVIHTKSEVNYILQHSPATAVNVFPIGAVSTGCKGNDITEMIDMYRAGAIAFSDGSHPVQDNGMMLRALQYVKSFEGIIINQPYDVGIAPEGQMHEGVVSTSLGMKGIPNLAEELMAQRDIYLAEYADSRLHLANISTAQAVALVRQAKAKGLRVTCSVPALNLAFDDRALVDYDSNFKVLPPLRSPEDREALRQGLRDGTIDMISANHVPLEIEAKELEFPYADFGAIGLETAFALANTHLGELLTLEELITRLSHNPRRIFGLENLSIRDGARAELTLFDPQCEWVCSAAAIRSRSRNSPLLEQTLRGVIWGVINQGQSVIWASR